MKVKLQADTTAGIKVFDLHLRAGDTVQFADEEGIKLYINTEAELPSERFYLWRNTIRMRLWRFKVLRPLLNHL